MQSQMRGKTIEEFLGLQLSHSVKDGTEIIHTSQPHLIDGIINSVPGMRKSNPRLTPACPTTTLTKNLTGVNRRDDWNNRSVVGMLNYLVNSTHPELAFAVHQCARFCENLKRSHKQAIKHIIKYILATQQPS